MTFIPFIPYAITHPTYTYITLLPPFTQQSPPPLLPRILTPRKLPYPLLQPIIVRLGLRHILPCLLTTLFNFFEFLAKLDDAFEAFGLFDFGPEVLYLFLFAFLGGLFV